MPRITEPLHNGLVTARDAALLQEGELQRAANTVYMPNDTALHAAPAETQAASGLGGSVTGLVHCAFDFVESVCDLINASTTVNVHPLTVNSVSLTSGSTTITAPISANFNGIREGASVSGLGIPIATVVVASVSNSNTQLVLSLPASASVSSNLTFTNVPFLNVSPGATVAGDGITSGTTVQSVGPSGTSIVITNTATLTGQSKLIVGADNLLVAQANGAYQTAKPGATGTSLTFATAESGVIEGDSLDQVHYNNLHVLLNGKHPNRVLRSDGKLRAHGLIPVTAAPTLEIVSGTWALNSGVGFYAYWTTEYDINNDLESDYSPGTDNDGRPKAPALIEITTVGTQAVKVTRPPRVNQTATHWRVYRSVKYTSTTRKSADRENQFPNGFVVAQLELRDDGEQTSFVDGGGATSVATVAAGTASSETVNNGGGDTLTWTSASAATGAANTVYAKLIGIAATAPQGGGWQVQLELSGYSFASISAPITGITVNVYGRRVGQASLKVLATTTDDTRPPLSHGAKTVPLVTGSDGPYALGGTSDLWNRTWDVSDFSSGRFCVRLVGRAYLGQEVWIDAVTVAVTYGESQEQVTGTFLGDTTASFPAVTVTPYGFTISSGRNGQPPVSTTGDIFQDSLLINDIDDPSLARYSFPSKIDAFPPQYFLNFDTKEQDTITLIRAVGNVAVVGLKHQLYRLNYLPRSTDAEFERGRAVELIENSHGIAGRGAGVVFTMPGVGPTLAYANNYGLFLTDGYRVRPATPDLDWWSTVDLTRLDQSKFINNTELQVLEFYYVPVDAAITAYATKQLYLHYHPSHLKGDPRSPTLKVTGPRDTAARSGVSASFANGTRKVYVGTPTGTINYINRLTGVLDTVDIQTRALIPAERGNEWRLNEVALGYTLRDYLAVSPGTFGVTAIVTKTGALDRTSASKSITIPIFAVGTETNPKSRRISQTIVPESGQEISLRIQPVSTGTPRCSFDTITIDGIAQGIENPT